MKTISVTKFGGIAPIHDGNLAPGMAVTAQNCDLSSGKLKPLSGNTLVKTVTTKANSIVQFGGEWLDGNNCFYLPWELETGNILVFLDGGIAKKTVDGVTVNLGQTPPDAPTVSDITVKTDLTNDDDYEWRESSTNGDQYCIARKSLDNLHLSECDSLTGWTDADAGVGAASTQATFDTRSTFRLDSGNAAAGNVAKRTQDIGSLPDKFRVEISIYLDTWGTLANVDYFQLDASTTGLCLSVRMASDGLFIYDGAAWNEVGLNLVELNEWNTYSFLVDGTTPASATCTVCKDGSTSVIKGVDCSYTGAFTNGLIVVEQHGDTNANRIAYLDWIKVGNDPTLSLVEPGEIRINDVAAARGDITGSSLADKEWDYGDKDNLGFDTVYVNLEGSKPQHMGDLVWHLSASGTAEYYCTNEDGTQSGFTIDTTTDIGPSVVVNGESFTQGAVGSLMEAQWAYLDNDSLGFRAPYFRFKDDADPSVTEQVIRMTDFPGSDHSEWKTVGEADIDADEEFEITHIENPGEVDGSVYYVICTERNVRGHIDKSGPSAVSAKVKMDTGTVRITAPTFTDPYITYWYIYRLSNASAEYEMAAKKDISATHHDDDLADADLGEALDTEYTGAKSGVTITHAPPLEGLDGLSNDTHNAIVFAWRDSTLYWCEPGKPDAWPSVYSINFRHSIRNVIVGSGMAVVLCKDGPYPINGTHPELLSAPEPIGSEPCVNRAACATSRGIVYVSDSGLVLVNLSGTSVITDSTVGKEWWQSNIRLIYFMAESDGKLLVAHHTETLVLDASTSNFRWFTLSGIFFSAYKNPTDGYLYVTDSTGIQKFMDGDDLSLTWKSGKLFGDGPREKVFDGVYVRGSGVVTMELSLDGISAGSKTLDLDSHLDRDKIKKFPEQSIGRFCQVQLSGYGTVDDFVVGYSS